jgi:hypothetical protein
MKTAELPGVDYVSDVVKELDRQIYATQQANRYSHKSMKVNIQYSSSVCSKQFEVTML